MKKDSATSDAAAAVAPPKTNCQFKFLWGPEPCEVFYLENDECPCPKSRHRSYFARRAPCKKFFCDTIDHYYNRIEDANDKQIPNSFVNPQGNFIVANWTQELAGGGRHPGPVPDPEPVQCVYGVNSVVLIAMGGVSVLCLLFVLSMCLHVLKMKKKYQYDSAIRSLEEGANVGDDDDGEKDDDDDNGDDDDDDEEKKSLKEKKGKRAKKKKKKKRKGFFVMLGNGPQHLGIKK